MANILYYGNGNCAIEASDVFGLEIRYRGRIKIIDKTSDNYHLITNDKKIMIFSTGRVDPLNDLFEYQGEFKIKSVLAADSNAERVKVKIKRSMDYSEMLTTNAEDMTTNSEKLNSGYRYGASTSKTYGGVNVITHQITSDNILLYDGDGNPYHGHFHVHLDGKIMSGEEHTNASQNLFIQKADRDKKQTAPTPKKQTAPKLRTGGGGSSGGGGGY